MSTILKHTIRNIFAKPLIMIFLVLSIAVCSFTGMLAMDMTNSLENVLKSLFANQFGKANIIYETDEGINEENLTDIPREDIVYISSKNSKICVRNDNMYAFYNEKNLTTYGVNIDDAKRNKLISDKVELNDDECVVTKKVAEDLNLEIGDTFTIFGDNYVKVDYKVKDILPVYGVLSKNSSALVTEGGMKKLIYNEQLRPTTAYIHVADKIKSAETVDRLKENDPTADIQDVINGEMVQEQIRQNTMLFVGLFLITLMLVIFVTITLSERIMIERMSTVGTLRSLGVSPGITARVILIENMFYGLFGGIVGAILYASTRETIFNGMLQVNMNNDIPVVLDLGKVSILAMIVVIIGAIIIEMLCPLRELLKATNRPIRDLIFDNKDTDYKYKKKYLVMSIILGILAAVLFVLGMFVFNKNGFLCVLDFVVIIVALYIGYPFILRAISSVVEKISFKSGNPIMGLAATNLRSKKTSIGSSKLTFIATSVSICLLVLITSYDGALTGKPADADVVVNGLTENADSYEYFKTLEGVSDVEYFYDKSDKVTAGTDNIDNYIEKKYEKNSEKLLTNTNIIGTDGDFKLCKTIKGLPEQIGDDEVYITEKTAEELQVKVGDEVEFLLNGDGVVPFRQTFKIAGFFNSSANDYTNKAIAMNLNNYGKIYYNNPSKAYIKTSNPEKTKDLIQSYSSSRVSEVKTMDEYVQDIRQQGAGAITLIALIMVMGIGLALIGVFCNQIVGFENRRRESAVLISTAINREKLVKLFMCENFASSIIAILLGTAFGVIETILIFGALSKMIALPIIVNYVVTGGFLAILFITFSITIFKTMSNIKKMKIAEQLKYE
ncbi:MAG: FtsX-like permease family protein [Eubacterium sp.]|nr:FtsX-like permease family protein [Eubacterium sp.]